MHWFDGLSGLWRVRLEEERALRRMRARADRLMVWTCAAAERVVAVLCGRWYGEWAAALWMGTPMVAIAWAFAYWMPGRFTTRMVIAFLLMVFSGLLIHQSHGLIEAHFSIFSRCLRFCCITGTGGR